jgi:hypothetical protein
MNASNSRSMTNTAQMAEQVLDQVTSAGATGDLITPSVRWLARP